MAVDLVTPSPSPSPSPSTVSPPAAPPPGVPARDRMANLQQLQAAMHQADDDTYSLHAALANAVEGIARMDFEGRYVWVNPAYCMISGRLPDELVGHKAEEVLGIVDAVDLDLLRRAYMGMLRDGRAKAEVRGSRPDGTLYWKQITLVPATNRLGTFIGHFRFVHDISHRKRNEENLRVMSRTLADKDRRFRSLVQSAPEAVVGVDAVGAIVVWNDEATHLFGWSAAEAYGKPLAMLMPERDYVKHAAAFAAAMADEALPVRRRLLTGHGCCKGGGEFPVEVTLSVWEEKPGGPRMATAFVRCTGSPCPAQE